MLFRGVRPSPLRLFQSREPVHADELMGEIVAKRRLEHLERVGFVAMTRAVGGDGAREVDRNRSKFIVDHTGVRLAQTGSPSS
jgi:hypothetical protein